MVNIDYWLQKNVRIALPYTPPLSVLNTVKRQKHVEYTKKTHDKHLRGYCKIPGRLLENIWDTFE